MTSTDFQTVALSWIGAAAIVIPAAVAVVVKTLPSIIALKTQVEALHSRVDRQGQRQDTQEATIAQVALATPPTPTSDQPVS